MEPVCDCCGHVHCRQSRCGGVPMCVSTSASTSAYIKTCLPMSHVLFGVSIDFWVAVFFSDITSGASLVEVIKFVTSMFC